MSRAGRRTGAGSVEASGDYAGEYSAYADIDASAAVRAGRAGKSTDPEGAEDLGTIDLPSTAELESAYERVSYLDRLRRTILSTTNVLIVVAAVAILVAMLFLPVLRIYGQSMNSTLVSGELVVSVKNSNFKTGDVIAFYYNNNILVKRVIATSGQWVDMDLSGNVYVDNVLVEEPYLNDKSYGEPNIDFPYQVPDERIFVLGDNRSVSVDSRNSSVGCVTEEQIVGKIVFRVWPLNRIGPIQ